MKNFLILLIVSLGLGVIASCATTKGAIVGAGIGAMAGDTSKGASIGASVGTVVGIID